MPAKTKKSYPEAQNPLILRCHRLMEAFAKSDDERDFYLDRVEGFIVYANLDRTEEELAKLEKEVNSHTNRYCMIPKLTFYETKKIMEGFVHEKVYDIDTKEKLLDLIQAKEARENFLEFIYDHHSELEKWQQYYQERSRIRIIEWLRLQHFHFVFEEDLDFSTSVLEHLKKHLFDKKVPRDVEVARKTLVTKAKTYYSNEALNPRPKRGRPPKQPQKLEMEPQITTDIYTKVLPPIRPFLFTPEITSVLDVTFSSRFETGEELLAHRKQPSTSSKLDESMNNISQKLATLKEMSSRWMETESKTSLPKKEAPTQTKSSLTDLNENEMELYQKLEQRKKTVKGKQKETAEKKPAKAKKKETPKKKPVKRIIPTAKAKPKPKVKKVKKPAKTKAAPPKKEKATKAPAKRPVRRITPQKAKPAAAPKKKIPLKRIAKVKPKAKQR